MTAPTENPSGCAKPGVETRARAIIRDLRRMADPVKAEGTQRYFKHPVAALGIDTATGRHYARQQVKQLKLVWTASEALKLCDRLFREPELEIRGTGLLILSGFVSELDPSVLPTAKRWLKTQLDNWALVDSFCSYVLSPLFESHPSVEQTLREWSRDKSLWVRRASLVTLISVARRGQFLDLAFDLSSEHFSDSEDLMHKAMGWVLREAGYADRQRLERFLLARGPELARTTVRYAIEKFPERRRKQLLRLTSVSR